ncbi:MAG: TROVE domain-containing protein [Bacteroidia bacterium]|jgi:hypothetical protein|nr:TROVE domain-containing protein [Bacteroidia bacterium]
MKFNINKQNQAKVKNHEGAEAVQLNAEWELYAAVATAGLSDTFYEKGNDRMQRIRQLIAKNDPEFVAKLALYARSQMYLRSVPMLLAVELAARTSGNALVRKTVNGVVLRADEITEMLACYQAANKRQRLNKLSKQMQKGLADAFNRFDEYQFSKYNRDGAVKLRDALFLVHPKAKDEAQQEIFNKIAAQNLRVAYTWETELSALGQHKFSSANEKAAAIRAKWEELIDSGKLGYMALLRNLRNIMEAGVSAAHLKKVCATLGNAQAVANAKQLPFRFLAAYREVQKLDLMGVNLVLNALEDAIMASAQNLKGFDQNTRVVIACDVSGSMQQPVSAKSKVLLYDIGLVLGMLLQSKCESVISGMFGDTWKVINMPNRGVLANVNEYYRREGEVGYSTNGHLVIEDLIKRNVQADKVMLFTDMQLWNSNNDGGSLGNAWVRYKKIAPQAKLYLFDLAGHGHAPISVMRHDVSLIAGWSDKVFDVLQAMENGGKAIAQIKQINL